MVYDIVDVVHVIFCFKKSNLYCLLLDLFPILMKSHCVTLQMYSYSSYSNDDYIIINVCSKIN